MYAILAELKHSTIREHCGEFAGQTGQNWWDEDDSANRANREFNNLRVFRAQRTNESLFLRQKYIIRNQLVRAVSNPSLY